MPIRPVRASLLAVVLLVVLAVPAWAAPSFTSGGTAEAGATGHSVTMQVPEDERIGTTSEVRMVAPMGFVPDPGGCVSPVGWSCTVAARTVVWTSGGLTALGTFGFEVDVPASPGTYAFPVTQSDSAGESVSWTAGAGAPTMTVTGEAADDSPEPSPTASTSPAPSPSPTRAATPSPAPSAPSDSGAASPSPRPSPTAAATEDDGATTTGGSTAPTRTQGRTSGSTLEVTPQSAPGDPEPSVADPDVAVAPPAPAASPRVVPEGAAQAAGAAPAAADDGEGLPWQQVLGGLLLAVGAGIVGYRRWRAREA